MAKQIPEVDIIVDHEAGVIREVQPEKKLRSKAGHEKRVNTAIYTVLIAISIVWLLPFVFLVLQSFRSYLTESGGMVDYLLPKKFSLDNYRFLFDPSQCQFVRWYGNTFTIALFVSVIQTAFVLCES